MTHLLHEVKDELDWAAREVLDVEGQFAVLEAKRQAYQDQAPSDERDQRIREIEDKKKALNITETESIPELSETEVLDIKRRHKPASGKAKS